MLHLTKQERCKIENFLLAGVMPQEMVRNFGRSQPPSTANSNGIGLRKIQIPGRTPITASSAGNATRTKSAIFRRQAVWGNAVAAESFRATNIVRIL